MTTDPDAAALHIDDDRLRRTSARLDLLSRELAAVADPREPDVGQHLMVDGRLAIPVSQPAHQLADLLGALAGALVASARGAGAVDGDVAAWSRLLSWELR
ncbi:hypothetical protein [Nocardioides bigeumensis]|uniref:YbaB/EbfC DNA-binding family protein n=1 Tax=Nocardioides bigeumensis TaxID=433657 RepID=A0ABN2YW85_9ACTN